MAAFPAFIRAQCNRSDSVGACSRILLRLARTPGARNCTLDQLLAVEASIATRRYIRSVMIDASYEWVRQSGVSNVYGAAVFGRLVSAIGDGYRENGDGPVVPWAGKLEDKLPRSIVHLFRRENINEEDFAGMRRLLRERHGVVPIQFRDPTRPWRLLSGLGTRDGRPCSPDRARPQRRQQAGSANRAVGRGVPTGRRSSNRLSAAVD
jgi:hypothetical protein